MEKNTSDLLGDIFTRHDIDKDTAETIRDTIKRINDIDEYRTFKYYSLDKFQKEIDKINTLKNKATESFMPFSKKYNTSLCAAMGVPMMESINRSVSTGRYKFFHELFGLTNIKAKKFGLAALHCALDGNKNEIPYEEITYNIVFDRDSPWTYRNEVEHMEEYARYHFNSFLINQIENPQSNPFEPVISLYENGAADFIFMQTQEDQTRTEKLCTFHLVNIPKIGNVIGVHMTGDNELKYFRRWGDPYFDIKTVIDTTRKLKIIGIADQRFSIR